MTDRFNVSIPIRVSEALKLGELSHAWRFKNVSIPIRVSEALKPSTGTSTHELLPVSIPIRVSEALKLLRWAKIKRSLKFQSLLGFRRL